MNCPPTQRSGPEPLPETAPPSLRTEKTNGDQAASRRQRSAPADRVAALTHVSDSELSALSRRLDAACRSTRGVLVGDDVDLLRYLAASARIELRRRRARRDLDGALADLAQLGCAS